MSSLNRHASQDRPPETRPELRDGGRSTAVHGQFVHRKGGTSTEGTSQVRSWWNEGPTLRSHDLDIARAHLVGKRDEQGCGSRSSTHPFRICTPPFGPVRFRVLKDGR